MVKQIGKKMEKDFNASQLVLEEDEVGTVENANAVIEITDKI